MVVRGGIGIGGHGDVVKSDHGNIARDIQPGQSNGMHSPDCHQVVKGDNRGRTFLFGKG